MKQYTTEQAAKIFGVSLETIKSQYSANAKQLRGMWEKAIKTGKKVKGATEQQLFDRMVEFEEKAA